VTTTTATSETPPSSALAAFGWVWWVVKIALGIGIIAGALGWAYQFPVLRFELLIGFSIYIALLLWRPAARLIVLPAALPVLELTYWSGRVFYNEFDMLLLISVGACLFRRGVGLSRLGTPLLAAAIVLVLYNIFVTWNGLFPIKAEGLGHGVDYLSSTNALREAKGFIFALALLPALALENAKGTDIRRYVTAGMVLGLVLAGGTIIWERGLFTGVFNFDHPYRVSGWFFAMHVGGAPLDAFLALSTPFIVAAFYLWRNPVVRLFLLGVAGLAIYAFYVTYSRANYPAVFGMLAVFAVGMLLSGRLSVSRFKSIPVVGALSLKWLAIIGGIGFVIMLGGIKWAVGTAILERFSTVSEDLGTRFSHWSDSIDLVPGDAGGILTGIGRGVFPRAYLKNSPTRGEHLTKPDFRVEEGDGIVRFNTSDDNGALFLRQRFERGSAKIVRLSIKMRTVTPGPERLIVEFCERHILKFLTECRWVGYNLDGKIRDWKTYSHDIDLYSLGARSFGPFSVPIEVSIVNRGIEQGVDISDISLTDKKDGRQLLHNTGFDVCGLDHWFVSYGNHLRWHIKNIFVFLFVEGGILALTILALVVVMVVVALTRSIRSGDFFAICVAACCVGVVFVGLFDSILDDPKIALMSYLLLWLALMPASPAFKAGQRGEPETVRQPARKRRAGSPSEQTLEPSPELVAEPSPDRPKARPSAKARPSRPRPSSPRPSSLRPPQPADAAAKPAAPQPPPRDPTTRNFLRKKPPRK
jgi:hypothetical protein